MKFLGIDFGSKRVGIAFGDSDAGMAFPKYVLQNNDKLLENVLKEIENLKVSKVIMGESKNSNGEDNPINKEILEFRDLLKEKKIEVILVPEDFSSIGASRIQGENDMLDASSATIILQSYMDRLK